MHTSDPASKVTITHAESEDFSSIQRIYAEYVLHTTISLEDEPPSVEEMKNRWKKTCENNLPYIVAKINGEVVGYAYAFPYRQRSAYRFTVEESIYVVDGLSGRGIGQQLLRTLMVHCRNGNYKQMVAIIAGSDNIASIKFHESLGFKHVGILQKVGFKLNEWVDTIIMQAEL